AFTFTANGACGGTITPSLQLQDGASNEGTLTYGPIILGVPAPPTIYSSGGVAAAIPDSGNMVDQVINVPTVGTISDVNVKIRLNHTWDGDLSISLVSPNGTVVPLSSNRGGSGDNFGSGATDCSGTFTVFDDAAATAISGGSAPFIGTFRPESPLSAMNGGPANGNWTLKINDCCAFDSGTLYCWQIEITSGAVCNACLPSADVSIIGSASPSPIVSAGGNITYTYTATNNGASPAADVTITSTVVAGTTFVSASPSPGATLVAQPAVGGTGAVTYTWFGSTANGATHNLGMVVNVPPATVNGTVIGNTATASSTTGDPNGANNTTTQNVTVGIRTR
ncbi:MAG: proprotein convertase P-domain-containing protein, partial [Acidobacteriota bacterium]|nr:proprotein convertase P-domain-containing protein [Acidobacteriota bacterium]